MFRIAACDDNEIQLSMTAGIVRDYAQEHGLEVEVDEYISSKKLLETATESPYDLYLLDIVMPEMNGIELASSLRMLKDNGLIIFLTASIDYAAVSYDVNAFYYILKPIDPIRLYHVFDKAFAKLEERNGTFSLPVRTVSGTVEIRIPDISYIELENRAVCYHMKDGKIYEGLKLRGSFSDEVAAVRRDPSFAACGVGMLVNLAYIENMDDESILMRDGKVLYPSKSACQNLKRDWKLFRTQI